MCWFNYAINQIVEMNIIAKIVSIDRLQENDQSKVVVYTLLYALYVYYYNLTLSMNNNLGRKGYQKIK